MLYFVQKNGDHTMADKNLHDIKIDDLEGSKKTPLKNLLTLLALLFIILVISVVITKLILNTDSDTNTDESNISTTQSDINGSGNSALAATGAAIAGATGAVIAGTQNATANTTDAAKNVKDAATNSANAVKEDAKNLSLTALKERNLTGSKTKVTLRDHRPLSSVKELVTPKETAKKDSSSSKKSTSSNTGAGSKKSSTSAHKNSSSAHKDSSSTSHKNAKSDKVVAKKSTSSKHTSSKSIAGYTLTHGYYIKIGTFKNPKAAIAQIKKTGLNYKLIKVKDDKTLTRVFIGTFSSKTNAQSNLRKAKKISKGAYIIKK